MDLLLELVLFFIIWYMVNKYYKYKRENAENIEEQGGEFIFTRLVHLIKKEFYFSIHEVLSVNFSKIVMNMDGINKFSLSILLEDSSILKIYNKRNAIIFLKSCKENRSDFYDKIFVVSDVLGNMSSFLGLHSIKEMVDDEIQKIKR